MFTFCNYVLLVLYFRLCRCSLCALLLYVQSRSNLQLCRPCKKKFRDQISKKSLRKSKINISRKEVIFTYKKGKNLKIQTRETRGKIVKILRFSCIKVWFHEKYICIVKQGNSFILSNWHEFLNDFWEETETKDYRNLKRTKTKSFEKTEILKHKE